MGGKQIGSHPLPLPLAFPEVDPTTPSKQGPNTTNKAHLQKVLQIVHSIGHPSSASISLQKKHAISRECSWRNGRRKP